MKVQIKEFPNDGALTILGHTFNGLQDIRDAVGVSARITISYIFKERDISRYDPEKSVPGIYVLKLYERYPCFDSEDYASENRYYQNFFFSTEPFTDERINKIAELANTQRLINYNLVSDKLPLEYLPAVYFRGDPNDNLIVALPESD